MKLTHLGISHYRSIGEEPVILDLTKKLTVLVGANNCGKSNIMHALEWAGAGNSEHNFGEVDYHNRVKDPAPKFLAKIAAEASDAQDLRAMETIEVHWDGTRRHSPVLHYVNFDKLPGPQFLRFHQSITGTMYTQPPLRDEALKLHLDLGSRLFVPILNKIPRVVFIPQFREIKNGENYSIEGQGIVNLLARWQDAPIGKDSDEAKFLQIQDLLRSLLELPDIRLHVTRSPEVITVRKGSLRLPLSSFGTGIHQLIILSVAVLSQNNAMICIEEPEVHLHPLLQRRFVEFLRDKTSNNYVITTHSPALIAPAKDTNVIHLWLENNITKSRTITTSADSLRALNDLGARASDLLQANSVIWVEGPSDRTYLNRWLELLHSGKYREGIDYTVMFYGGRLLSHLSMERDRVAETKEDEGAELIQLLKINQHSAILIDSDRRKAADMINPTKERIKTESAASGVFCWITPGREIENCLPVPAIEAAFGALAEKTVSIKLKPYQDIEDALASSLKSVWKRAQYYEHAKAQRAHEISVHMTAEQLSQDIRDLIAGIVNVIEHKLR